LQRKTECRSQNEGLPGRRIFRELPSPNLPPLNPTSIHLPHAAFRRSGIAENS
jgi:hypothetical protein